MITTYKHLPSLCLLILVCSLAISCSTEQAPQPEATVVTKAEQKTPAAVENTVVANEDDVLTWEESADKAKTTSEKESSDK